MNWLCCKMNHARKIFPQNIYSWYVKPQQQSSRYKKITDQILRYNPEGNQKQFDTWIHTKIKSKNIDDITEYLQDKNWNYIDEDFPHSIQNISKEPIEELNVQWKRVKEIVRNSIFMKTQGLNSKSIENYQTSNKAFKNALLLMARSHPQKLHRGLCQKISQRGIYQFKLFKKGIIYNVIIDDYLPTIKNNLVFSGPCNQNEIYPILLEKAIAKLSGGYSQIPNNPLDIMQMLYCGASMKQQVDNLNRIEQVQPLIFSYLQRNGLVLLVAKDNKKIRQNGLNPNQLYHIINYHTVTIDNEKITLIEMLSENKMSSWNGNFNIIDPNWKKLPEMQKLQILKQMQQNQSFCIPLKQIGRVFECLIVFKDIDSFNKQWFQSYSQKNTLGFSSFTLNQQDNIFIQLNTQNFIRQSLIIAKQTNKNQFQYIGGSFNQNTDSLNISGHFEPGTYHVAVFQDWNYKDEGQYIIYLSSGTRIQLKSQRNPPKNFLESICLNYERSNSKNQQSISYNYIEQIGLGYLKVDPSSDFNKQPIRKVKINKCKLQVLDWKLMEPYDNMKEILVNSKVAIILIMAGADCTDPEHNFPTEGFRIQGEEL